jgi:predicted hydrolase (HD superfamily)
MKREEAETIVVEYIQQEDVPQDVTEAILLMIGDMHRMEAIEVIVK